MIVFRNMLVVLAGKNSVTIPTTLSEEDCSNYQALDASYPVCAAEFGDRLSMTPLLAALVTSAADRTSAIVAPIRNSLKRNRRPRPAAAARPRRRVRVSLPAGLIAPRPSRARIGNDSG